MKEDKIEMKKQEKEPLETKSIEPTEWGAKDSKLRKIYCFSKPEKK